MKKKIERSKKKTPRIAGVGITKVTLTSRDGLSLFVSNLEQLYDYVEVMDKCGTWTKSRRAICCKP